MLTIPLSEAASADEAALPPGVTLAFLPARPSIENEWLAWFPSGLAMAERTGLGLLRVRHVPQATFTEVEWHSGPEVFLMVQGEGSMLLPHGEQWLLVLLPQGTALRVGSGVPHYFGPSVTAEALCAVATCEDAETESKPI